MKRILFCLSLAFFLCQPCVLAHGADLRTNHLVKSQYFDVYGFKGLEIPSLLKKINFNYLLRVDQLNLPKNNTFKDLLIRTMDALFLEVSDILRVNVANFHAQVYFLENQEAVEVAYSTFYKAGFKEDSFYQPQTNCIYISYADLTLGQLGYEVAQGILSHYFVVSPNRKVQDVLAGYVQYNLRKATGTLPENETATQYEAPKPYLGQTQQNPTPKRKINMRRQTKIICTLGPACERLDTLYQMAKAGMDVARVNFSHGDQAQHQKFIDLIRQANRKYKLQIKVLQDLEGYRIRIGHLRKTVELEKGKKIWLAAGLEQKGQEIPLEFFGTLKGIKPGMSVFIDDGRLHLIVVKRQQNRILLVVEQGGMLKSRKGVNIPDMKLQADIMTQKDQEDLAFGISNQVDLIAQSFVRNKDDIRQVVTLVRPHLPNCQIVAKIENREGVRNVSGIMEACDGILVARGDLGVSLPIYEIPLIQKDIIRRCNKGKKTVITATQMLESMTENNRPTRAEVSDVANAILDGTDYVMLSGETAVGRFPVQSVAMMAQISAYTEKSMYYLASG